MDRTNSDASDLDRYRFVTIGEVTRRTGIGRRQLQRAIAAGQIEVYDLGAWPRVRWADVIAWIERNRRGPAARREVRP